MPNSNNPAASRDFPPSPAKLGHYQGVGPLGREMFHIARYEIVGVCRLGTLQENVVVRIGAGTHFAGGPDPNTHFAYGPKRICDFLPAPFEAGPMDHFLILRIHLAAHA